VILTLYNRIINSYIIMFSKWWGKKNDDPEVKLTEDQLEDL